MVKAAAIAQCGYSRVSGAEAGILGPEEITTTPGLEPVFANICVEKALDDTQVTVYKVQVTVSQ